MSDPYDGLGTPVGGVAPAPAPDMSLTPEQYFSAIKSIYPTAVYNGGGRTPQRNAAVGGVSDSMHLTNQAVDFNVPGVPSQAVFSRLQQAGLPETEELNEGQVGNQGGHLHIGWRPKGGSADPYSGLGTPVQSQGASNDPYSGLGSPVQPTTPQQAPQPNVIQQGIMDLANSHFIKGVTGAYQEGVTNGMFMQPTRFAMEHLGVGMDELKQKFPGQSEQWYHDQLHQAYNGAVDQARQNAQAQTAANPYPGHIVGNTLANVVANPQFFLAPGGGTGPSVGARILSAAKVNAAVGAASDAAAQGMDYLEGQKKNFDITQNLTQAAVGGLAGGVLHGAGEFTPVISDYVKGLFGTRGIDTLPNIDPRTSNNTPTTGNSVTMSPEEQTQFKGLLKTGDVDDIKQFLATKQGPKPTWKDVNNLVQFRDNMPDQFVGRDNLNEAVNQHLADTNKQMVTDHIQQQTAGWKNAPNFEVIHDTSEIQDPSIRAQAEAEDHNGNALGFLGHDGTVRIFGSRVNDPDTLNAVLYHEGLGHFGLQQQFGDKLDSTLQTLLDRNIGQFGKKVDDWQKLNPEAYGGDRVRAAEEVLAESSEKGQVKQSWSDALSASVRQFGRKMGLKLAYSDNEINQILAMAHDAVVNGQGRNVTANGFQGAKNPLQDVTNRYMFTGQKATSFDPDHPTAFTPSDNMPRNEITDRYAKLTGMRMGKLEGVLDHPDLYAQYPQLRNLPVTHLDMSEQGWHGAYSPKTKRMYLDTSGADRYPLSTVLHEVQHAIQDIEGHHPNVPSDTVNLSKQEYLDSPLEKEARTTENRFPLTRDERAADEPRFITRDQLQKHREANTDYTESTLNDLAKHLEANYVPNKVSFEESQRQALEYGISPSQIRDLKQRDPGELAARVARMGSAAEYAQAKLRATLSKLDTPDFTMDDHVNMAKQVSEFHYLVARYKAEGNELGRALNIMRTFDSYTNGNISEVLGKLKDQDAEGAAALADPTNPEAIKFARQLKQMLNGDNPAGATNKMMGAQKPYWEQYLNTFHMNAMLSGLSTHFKAPIDMGTGIARDIIEKAVAMPIGKLRQLVETMTGKTPEPGVHPTELMAHTYGLVKSITELETYKRMVHAVKTGEGGYVDAAGKSQAISMKSQYMGSANPRIPGVSFPTDLIAAQDTFFRSMSMNAQLRALANREALTQLPKNASTSDILTLTESLARNPTLSMIKGARDLTDRTLLLNENPINKIIDNYRNYRPGLTPWERVGRFVVSNLAPFIRVESNNLMNRVIQRSPLGFLDPYTRKQLAMGGANADIALAKIVYGTTLLGMYWAAADKTKNYLQGSGPDNADKYKELVAGGFEPRSVHENGRYNEANSLSLSVNPFDSHNATATMVADMREAFDNNANKGQVGQGLKLALGSMFHDIGDMSWVKDIDPALGLFGNRGPQAESKFNQFIGQEADTWSPNLMGQTARLMDPNQHDTLDPHSIIRTVINSLQATVPGMTGNNPIKYSVYGNPIPNGASLTGVHTVIPGLPGNGRAETQDPAERELERLSTGDTALVTPVLKTINIQDQDGNTVKKKLTTEEFENYQRVAGRAIVETVRQEMNSPGWDQMSDDDKRAEIKSIQTDMKAGAREQLFGQ